MRLQSSKTAEATHLFFAFSIKHSFFTLQMPSEGKNMNIVSYPRTGKRGVPQQFPRRLYKMLQSESVSKETQAIMWSDSGAAFRIVDVHSFSSLILPKYFRTSKFSSFQRNLNLVSALH
jgi:hypothetical protein